MPKERSWRHSKEDGTLEAASVDWVRLKITNFKESPWILMERHSPDIKDRDTVSIGFIPTLQEIKEIISALQEWEKHLEGHSPKDEWESLVAKYR